MLATNGYDDDDYQQLLKEFKERQAERKASQREKSVNVFQGIHAFDRHGYV